MSGVWYEITVSTRISPSGADSLGHALLGMRRAVEDFWNVEPDNKGIHVSLRQVDGPEAPA